MHSIRIILMSILMGTGCLTGLSAQVLPILNSFRNRTFQGVVDVSWPVVFEGCTFVTDSIVLRHSYGAVFRHCTFESGSGVLYVADSGDGIILADCEINGCKEFGFGRQAGKSDRNYVTTVRLDGNDFSVPEDLETVIEIDGLELEESVMGESAGPVIMMMSADRYSLKRGETAKLTVKGLEKGMFVGWSSSDEDVKITVGDDGCSCRVSAPDAVSGQRSVIISAYTEYGLEAACELGLQPDEKKKKNR